jgi:site-specific DNA recombinase
METIVDAMVTKNVGVWIRVSTEDQARGDSPNIHKTRAEQYAQFKAWSIVEVYDLSGVSGKAVMDHPETQRMLSDIKSGRISALLFSKLARLARNTRELLEFAEIFRVHDAGLVSLQESIDTSTPSGRLFYTMIAAMAQWEREEIVDRVKAAVLTRAKMGKCVAGAAPYGYQWVDGLMIPHPDEAPVRALIYELFAEYQRKGPVARTINERGYRTRRGNEFAIQTIQHMLRDPTAKGLRRSNYTWTEGRGASVQLKPKEEWEWHACEAIVPVELWERCNAILDAQMRGKKPGPRGRYLFAGKVICGHDGHTMYVLNESPKFVCRKCRNKIPQADVETVFRTQLQTFFSSQDEITDYLNSTHEEIDAKCKQIAVLERDRAAITEDRAKVLRGYLDDKISMDRFGQLDGEAEEHLEKINTGIAVLEGKLAALRVTSDSSEEIILNARDLYGRWESLSHEDKGSVINSITETIVIGERDIAINLHYVPSTQDDGNYMQNTFSLLPSGSRK